MPGTTRQVAVTTGAYVAISPTVNGYAVSVGEIYDTATGPTTGFSIKKSSTADPIRVGLGGIYTCKAGDGRRVFRPEAIRMIGSETPQIEVLFYIQALDANATIWVDEEGL